MECQHTVEVRRGTNIFKRSVCVFERGGGKWRKGQPEKGNVITLTLFPGWVFVLYEHAHTHTHVQ